ncbi:MAG: hypothetical protein U0992_12125 [Planctomycetaceae bacterium]
MGYAAVAVGCITHALLFMAAAWYTSGTEWGRLGVDYWFSGMLQGIPCGPFLILLLASWLIWFVPLRRISGRRLWLTIAPMALGMLAIGLGLCAIIGFAIIDNQH